MAWFRSSEERRVEQEQKKAEKELQKFMRSPTGKAREAKNLGHKIFQHIEVITETSATVVPMVTAMAVEGEVSTPPVEQIEAEGWMLINAGYVFQQTTTESRDKFMSSGQQEAISGRVLGVYTFRATETGTTVEGGHDAAEA